MFERILVDVQLVFILSIHTQYQLSKTIICIPVKLLPITWKLFSELYLLAYAIRKIRHPEWKINVFNKKIKSYLGIFRTDDSFLQVVILKLIEVFCRGHIARLVFEFAIPYILKLFQRLQWRLLQWRLFQLKKDAVTTYEHLRWRKVRYYFTEITIEFRIEIQWVARDRSAIGQR